MANTAALLPTNSVAPSVTGQPQAAAVQAPLIATSTGLPHAAPSAMRLPSQQFPAGAAAGAAPPLGAGGLPNPGAAVPPGLQNPGAVMPPGLPGALGVPPNMAAAGMAMPGAVAASLPGMQGAVNAAGAAGLGLVTPGDFASHLNAAASGPTNPVLQASNPYRDFSRIPVTDMVGAAGDAGAVGDAQGGANAAASSGKEPPFPVKLHRILSNPEFRDIITWLPHGRSWRVLKPKAFEERVIPLYFRHAKYASFMRQVNGWGFKRMTQGPDHNSYYHELFLRGLPHLCLKMRRPNRAKQGSADSDLNPDFYRISMVAPLPDGDDADASSAVPPPPGAAGPANGGVATAAGITAAGGTVGGLPLGLAGGPASSTPGVLGAAAPAGLNASDLLQQQLQGKLQKPADQPADKPATESSTGPKAGDATAAGGEDAGSLPSSAPGENNLEVFRQRIKERSELVRQLKEVMDGAGGSGGAGGAAASQQQLQQLQAGLPAQDSSVPGLGGGTAAVPQVMQSLGGMRPGASTAAGQAFPGMGTLSPFGQFQNPLAGQAPYEQLLLDQQNQNLFAAAGGAPAMAQNPAALSAAGPGSTPNLGNIGLMAMQNQALLAQMQAVQQQSQLQMQPQMPGSAPGAAPQAPAALMPTIGAGLGAGAGEEAANRPEMPSPGSSS